MAKSSADSRATFIALRRNLFDDPRVHRIAAATGLDAFGVVGRLARVWAFATEHVEGGFAAGVGPAFIDSLVGVPGFSAAMVGVGWLATTKDSLTFPDWHRWLSKSARRRAVNTARMAQTRAESGTDGAQETHKKRTNNARDAHRNGTVEPQNLHYKDKDTPPLSPPEGGGKDSDSEAQADDGDPLTTAIRSAFPGLAEAARGDRVPGLARAVEAFRRLDADPDLIAPALRMLREDMPRAGWPALVDRWPDLSPRVAAKSGADPAATRRAAEHARRVADLRQLPAERLEALLEFCRTGERGATWPDETRTVAAALADQYTAELMHDHSRPSHAFAKWMQQQEAAA